MISRNVLIMVFDGLHFLRFKSFFMWLYMWYILSINAHYFIFKSHMIKHTDVKSKFFHFIFI